MRRVSVYPLHLGYLTFTLFSGATALYGLLLLPTASVGAGQSPAFWVKGFAPCGEVGQRPAVFYLRPFMAMGLHECYMYIRADNYLRNTCVSRIVVSFD